MDDVHVREAAPHDAEALAAAYRDAYRESRELGFPMGAGSATPEEVTAWIRDYRVLVAETEREIVGGVRLAAVDDATMKLSRLGVRDGWKGLGIGSRLLDRAEDAAEGDGFESVRLTAPENHPYLVEFYRSRGYRITGDYPIEFREYDEVVMEKSVG